MSDTNISEQTSEEEKKEKNQIKRKLKSLWSEKRRWTKRLLIAAVAIFCGCFTFVFFGPTELVAFNAASLTFEYKDITVLLGTVAAAILIVLTLLISILRGKIFNYAVTTVFAATVSGYLQANFLNGQFGALTGTPIDWHLSAMDFFFNLLIWIAVFLVIFFVLYLSKKIWEKMVVYVSLALVVMQLVPCIGIFAGAYDEAKPTGISGYWLSTEGMFEYSSKSNVFVFVLDRLDYDYIEEVIAEDPAFFDRLDGFTSYTNAISTYARTWPAANHMLTGYTDGAYKMPLSQYLTESWVADDRNILKELSRKGYDISIYSGMSTMFGDGGFAEKYVENVASDKQQIDPLAMLRKMMILSCYRYAPVAFKPFFWSDTNFYNTDIYATDTEGEQYEIYSIDEARYVDGFSQINTDAGGKCFKFYHFNGPHDPYTLNADGTKSDGTTTSLAQTMGSFNILYLIFDRMKELGIYEDATIIISADHGSAINDYTEVLKPTRIGLFYKPAGSSGTPLSYSKAQVSTTNLPATLVKAAGGDFSKYGRPIDDIAEDEEITRVYYKTAETTVTGHEGTLYTYSVRGDAADFDNWVLVETETIEYPFN